MAIQNPHFNERFPGLDWTYWLLGPSPSVLGRHPYAEKYLREALLDAGFAERIGGLVSRPGTYLMNVVFEFAPRRHHVSVLLFRPRSSELSVEMRGTAESRFNTLRSDYILKNGGEERLFCRSLLIYAENGEIRVEVVPRSLLDNRWQCSSKFHGQSELGKQRLAEARARAAARRAALRRQAPKPMEAARQDANEADLKAGSANIRSEGDSG